jgi:hypothetical protein
MQLLDEESTGGMVLKNLYIEMKKLTLRIIINFLDESTL